MLSASNTLLDLHNSSNDTQPHSLIVNSNITTGNPGSVIIPQYGSSKITVFVWGKKIFQIEKRKSSLLSISAAILFLRSWRVYFPLELEFCGKSCVE